MVKTVLVINPGAEGGRTGRRWPQLHQLISDHYGPFEPRFTAAPGDATRLTRAALADGAELIVAFGGDGTINEVVNGFFDGTTPCRPEAALGVLPAGTGGDFKKTLGVPRTLAAACAALHTPPRRIDVGRLHFTTDAGPALRHFINVASFGIGGLVDHYVNRTSKVLGGTLSFALATLRAGLRYKNASVRLTVDDQPPHEATIYNVAVANGRYFGGGMKIAPHAELDDGAFDVVTLGDFSFGDLLRRGLDIYSGRHLTNPKVQVVRARRLSAEPAAPNGAPPVLLDVDGEQPGRLPATFELVPGGLLVRAAGPSDHPDHE